MVGAPWMSAAKSNRAIDGHTATCMIECRWQVNAIKVKDAVTSGFGLQLFDELAVVFIPAVHRVNLEHQLGVRRGACLKKELATWRIKPSILSILERWLIWLSECT